MSAELSKSEQLFAETVGRMMGESARDIDTSMRNVRDAVDALLSPLQKQIADIRANGAAVLKISNETRAAIRIGNRHELTGGEKFIRHVTLRIAETPSRPIEALAKDFYRVTVEKASTPTGTATNPPWVGALQGSDVVEFMAGGDAPSVFGTLASAGHRVEPVGAYASVPYRKFSAAPVGAFIGQGQAIPVVAAVLDRLMLDRKKAGSISVITREAAQAPRVNVELFVSTILRSDLARVVDGVMLSNAAATANAPAGILNGIAAIATSGDMLTDIKALTAEVAAKGGQSIMLVTNLVQALDLSTLPTPPPFMASPNVPAGTVIALDPSSWVGIVDQPEVDASEEVVVHQADPAAALVGANASPPALGDISTPERSVWQTASLAIRTLLWTNWGVADQRVAWMQGVDWNAVAP